MCGIFAAVSKGGHVQLDEELKANLSRRGPDHWGSALSSSSGAYQLSFFSSVLALRGGHVTAQPLVDAGTGSILCWNGEAWKIAGSRISGNDGEAVLSLLSAATMIAAPEDSRRGILDTLRSVQGPFAFVFFDKRHEIVYFARDCLGRRSLLFSIDEMGESIQFSSLAPPSSSHWHEVEADGIYSMRLGDLSDTLARGDVALGSDRIERVSWSVLDSHNAEGFPHACMNLSLPTGCHSLHADSPSVSALAEHLKTSLEPRVMNIPDPNDNLPHGSARLAVLFSGGLDCTVLARMAHDLIPPEQSIDLLNVAFENPRVVQAAQRRSSLNMNSELSTYEACPDRMTGRNALRELQVSCPGRKWNFVAINVPYSETMAHKANVISLIHPHNTEMDLSIAFALYFAARGCGKVCHASSDSTTYTTTARVLLSGLGADELFGGYTRHATAFSRHGYKGLTQELELDVNRLGKRNLGRDDRVISNWGREARFPFLDETLVKWALEIPVWEKCGFGGDEDNGNAEDVVEPGKKVLRLLAQKLGLPTVAREKKRAIQFGARTAKMETGRTKGTTLVT